MKAPPCGGGGPERGTESKQSAAAKQRPAEVVGESAHSAGMRDGKVVTHPPEDGPKRDGEQTTPKGHPWTMQERT